MATANTAPAPIIEARKLEKSYPQADIDAVGLDGCINRLLWRRLYRLASSRFKLES
jgi:hypothetical protein